MPAGPGDERGSIAASSVKASRVDPLNHPCALFKCVYMGVGPLRRQGRIDNEVGVPGVYDDDTSYDISMYYMIYYGAYHLIYHIIYHIICCTMYHIM